MDKIAEFYVCKSRKHIFGIVVTLAGIFIDKISPQQHKDGTAEAYVVSNGADLSSSGILDDIFKNLKKQEKKNRFSDFLSKCFVAFVLFILAIFITVIITETTDSRFMYKLLNHSRDTIVEETAKYFELESVPKFKIYPLSENEFKVVFTDGKTVDNKDIVIAGVGDEGQRKVWEGK